MGAAMTQLISQAAIDLIVGEEVSGKNTYEKRYRHPVWPGGSSGVTIGIGYDVGAGVNDKAQLWSDWRGRIPDHMIAALEPAIGVTGERARALAARLRDKVDVPWDAAISVFERVDVPRWYLRCARALPNFDELSPDCKGALVSLAYNRGASFGKQRDPGDSQDRYREMRAIRQHMTERRFERIPGECRSMKRLWRDKGLDGLLARRDREASMFEAGLKQPAVPAPTPAPTPAPRLSTSTAQRIGWGAAFVSAFGALAHWIGGHPVITVAAVITAALVVLYLINNPKHGD
jgi:GH24 family phage-related lysozyme (muramidase)